MIFRNRKLPLYGDNDNFSFEFGDISELKGILNNEYGVSGDFIMDLCINGGYVMPSPLGGCIGYVVDKDNNIREDINVV